MHTPEHIKLSHRARRRVHKQMVIMACITVIPSIYLAYQTTQTSIKEGHVDTYIKECFNFPNTEVVQSSINENTIEVALLGEAIDNKTIEDLKSKLSDYNLESMSLKITQTQTNSDVDSEKLKELIQSLISNNVDIASFKDFMYKTNISEENSDSSSKNTIDCEKVSKSIRSLYTEVQDCYIGYVNNYENASTDDTIVVILSLTDRLSADSRSKLESWLSIELDGNEYILLEDVLPVETTQETTTEETSITEVTTVQES